MRKILIFLAVVIALGSAAAADWELSAPINSYSIKTYEIDNIAVDEIYYTCSTFQKKPVQIFGYYCRPKNKSNLPAIAIIHGGGGYAKLPTTLNFAKHGYAVLTIDLPGKGTLRSDKSRSTGPDMDVPTLLRVSPDPSYNYLYHAVRAARGTISFLESRAEVDKTKIGMLGLSWGGVITLIVNGVDKRLASAIPVFGSGYLDQGSTWQGRFDQWMSDADKKTYNRRFDAKNYLKSQHAPVLYMTGSNDHCFYIPNFIKSYRNMPPGQATLTIYPNGKHTVNAAMLNTFLHWFNVTLKKTEPPFSKITIEKIKNQKGFLMLKLSHDGTLYYSKSGVDRWTVKKWLPINSSGGWGKIPKELLSPEIIFFAGVRDGRGVLVTTPIYALMHFKLSDGRTIYALTPPVEEIEYHRISPQTWEEILGQKCDIPGDSFLLANLTRVGAKVVNKKSYYYIKLP